MLKSPKGVQRHSTDILADEFPEGHALLIMLSQAYTYTIYTSLDMVYSKPGFSAIERWHPRRQFVERATQAPNIRAWPSPPNSWAQRKMPSCFTFNRFRRYGRSSNTFMQPNGQKSSPRRVQFRETCRALGGWFNFLDPWIQQFQVSTRSSGCGGETPKDLAVCQRRTLHRLWHQRRPANANENTQKTHLTLQATKSYPALRAAKVGNPLFCLECWYK